MKIEKVKLAMIVEIICSMVSASTIWAMGEYATSTSCADECSGASQGNCSGSCSYQTASRNIFCCLPLLENIDCQSDENYGDITVTTHSGSCEFLAVSCRCGPDSDDGGVTAPGNGTQNCSNPEDL
jgi:hypothetical protein